MGSKDREACSIAKRKKDNHQSMEVDDCRFPANLDEYQKLVIRMNDTPRVTIDNAAFPNATLLTVDSALKHGALLDAVELLADLELRISKAYISSDGRWFMDVFHVIDSHGRKLTDPAVISSIEQSLESGRSPAGSSGRPVLELTGTDRPGLLSEVFAVLADLCCGIASAKVWTHDGRIGALVFLSDSVSVSDSDKICTMQTKLSYVLRGDYRDNGAAQAAAVCSSAAGTVHSDRRLHRMMSADREPGTSSTGSAPSVSVQNWAERGYSVVGVQCGSRPELLFDIVCTLTDMGYIVFHGTVDTKGNRANQEFYIRDSDGNPISSDAERQLLIQSLQAAIERRSCDGLRLELRAANQPWLLADVTRTFRENGLLVRRAEISAESQTATGFFYITDAAGGLPDTETMEAVRQRIGLGCLSVKEERQRPAQCRKTTSGGRLDGPTGGAGLLQLGSLVMRNLCNLRLIRFCS